MRLRLVVLPLAALLGGCLNLTLPPENDEPSIVEFSPHYAYGGSQLTVEAENVDWVGNTLIFPGGARVLAESNGVTDRVFRRLADGGVEELAIVSENEPPVGRVELKFTVPEEISEAGRLVLVNTRGQSELSAADFGPLGNGYPNKGTPVASLKFRHDPVGIVDTAENVLMASNLFDLLVTDGKAKYVAPGKPLALRASPNSPQPGRSLLSVATERGGMLLEVQTIDGKETLRSAERPGIQDLFILPPADASSVARTLGVNAAGKVVFTNWAISGGVLAPLGEVKELPFTEVLGASAFGPLAVLVVRETPLSTPSVWSLSLGAAIRPEWNPRTTSGVDCAQDPPLCELPDGPIAMVPMPAPQLDDGGVGVLPLPRVVVSVASGDLVVLEDLKLQTGTMAPAKASALTLISYAPVEAMAAGTTAGKVVFTKSIDGALFQYDVETGEADWAVQLRGEPSIIDVAPDIDEVAVGNHLDNAVDIVRASTGTWIGRVAFNLGVGSAGGHPGGIVAPYTYATPEAPVERMDLLMRNVGLVVSVNASSLELMGATRLNEDEVLGPVLRLAVSHDLKTFVIHEGAIGVLDVNAAGERVERQVGSFEAGFVPSEVLVMPSGHVVVGSVSSSPETNVVRAFLWDRNVLARVGDLRLPADSKLLALGYEKDEVLVVWQRGASTFGGGYYRVRDFAQQGLQPTQVLSFEDGLVGFVGLAQFELGPTLFFSGSAGKGPRALSSRELREDAPSLSSTITGPRLGGVTPGGRMVAWLDEDSSEPMVRLIRDATSGFEGYSTYRLAGRVAGPAFDPSGEWFYIPVPLLDQLDVVQ